MIHKWQNRLGIQDWNIRTEGVHIDQIDYNGEEYFIGIVRDFKLKEATIYHDIALDELSIVHELLHIVHPEELDGETFDEYEIYIDLLSKYMTGRPERNESAVNDYIRRAPAEWQAPAYNKPKQRR